MTESLSVNVKLCEEDMNKSEHTSARPSPAWFVKVTGEADNDWQPLWKRDSDRIEEHYQRGDINQDIPVRYRHGLANISKRTITESFYIKPKVEILRRGTWFYEGAKGKMLPFSEDTAQAMDHWREAIKLSKTSSGGRWQHDLGEVMGPGNGQFTIIAKLVHEMTVLEAGGKTATKEVEVLSPKSTEKEIRSAMQDEDNRLVYVLENRTSLLTSIFPSVKVEYGFVLAVHPDERICDIRPGHLVFVIHGIGEAMFAQEDSPAPSIQACTAKFKSLSLDCTHPTVVDAMPLDISNGSNNCGDRKMVEFLAIEWWDAVHGDDKDITKQMRSITAPTVPLMRQFGNTAALDILLYQTPEFQQRITTSVCQSMNYAYDRFCALNPDFCGDCSIIGHSLGSVITFDILTSQFVPVTNAEAGSNPEDGPGKKPSIPPVAVVTDGDTDQSQTAESSRGPDPTGALYASQTYLTASRHEEKVSAQQLVFKPKAFYAVGSPIGVFYTVRSKGRPFPHNFKLPTCPNFYNIFHRHDPVAYRLEPLFDPDLVQKEPFLIEHFSGMTLHNKFKKFSAELAQVWSSASNPSNWFSSSERSEQTATFTASEDGGSSVMFSGWFRGSSSKIVNEGKPPSLAETGKKTSVHAWSSLDDQLEGIAVNNEKRVDYVLQESTFEITNQYVSALFAHSGYFENRDFSLFVLRQIASQNHIEKVTE